MLCYTPHRASTHAPLSPGLSYTVPRTINHHGLDPSTSDRPRSPQFAPVVTSKQNQRGLHGNEHAARSSIPCTETPQRLRDLQWEGFRYCTMPLSPPVCSPRKTARESPTPRSHPPNILPCTPLGPYPPPSQGTYLLTTPEDHRMRHDELVLALVLPDEQRHIFLIEELEAVSGQDAPDRVVG